MKVADCCGASVVVAQRSTGIVEAASLMRQYHVGALVVVDSQCGTPVPVGMVTDRDLVVEVLAQGAAPPELTVGDIMSAQPLIVSAADGLLDTLERMAVAGVRRAPVVDEAGALAGVLSVDDALEALAEAIGRVPQLMRGQREVEQRRRA